MHQRASGDPDEPVPGGPPPAHIIEAACRKDQQAFAQLYIYYQQRIQKRLRYRINEEQTSHDLCQVTFERAWRSVSPKVVPYFERWLYAIADNVAFDYLRHKKLLTFLPLSADEPEEAHGSRLANYLNMTDEEEQRDALILFKEALTKMSPQYRQCWLLQVQGGYSQQEIAARLGISVKTVSTNVSRGYRQLCQIYADMLQDYQCHRKGRGKRNG